MMLKEKTQECFDYIKANGGKVSTAELADGLGVAVNSVTGRVNSLVKNGLAVREKVEVEGADKPITFVVLTEAGMNFVPSEEE